MTTSIDLTDWTEFRIKDLFDVVKGSRLTSLERVDGEIPYVGATMFNNGRTQMIGNDENIHPGNVLTVCYNGPVGTSFYQPEPFWATDDVNVLYPKFEMTPELGLFIAPLIESVGKNYAFIDKWKLEDMEEAKIKLPTLGDGAPNWSRMKSEMTTRIETAESSIEALQSLSESQSAPIDLEGWAPFRIESLFDVVKGSRLRSLDRVEGDIPYVGASLFNNGYTHMISNSEHIHPANVLTTAYNGTVPGKTFYQPVPFWATDDVNVLYPKFRLTKEIGLFIAPMIEAVGKNFVYIDKWKLQDMIDAEILLPVDSNGTPDWVLMEAIMAERIEQASSNLDILSEVLV